jgi:nickel transport protein
MTGNVRRAILLFVPVFGLVFPALVFGHGVEVGDLSGDAAAVRYVRFMYSTGEPVSYARIKLYPPSTVGANVESLVSITDRNGIFCFVPDEEGDWRVDMEDGMGHKGSITVGGVSGVGAADAPPAPVKSEGNRPPLAYNIVLGLSLLANIFGGWLIAARHVRKPATKSAVGRKAGEAGEVGGAHK